MVSSKLTEKENNPPVLVVGLNRSGTKWLSNLISAHPEVYSVQHSDHFGILESNVFNDFSRMFPDLNSIETRVAFEMLWSKTDFVNITNINLPDLLSEHRPENVFEAFKLLMNCAAETHNCTTWLQKCSPVQMAAHGEHFRNARRIFIKRRFDDVLVSAIENSKSAGRKTGEWRLVLNFCLQNQVLQNISRQPKTISVLYEDLKSDPDKVIAEVFEFLGLELDSLRQNEVFSPNTSFAGSKRRPRLKLSSRALKNIFAFLLRLMPKGIPFRIWNYLRGNASPTILRGSFRVTHERAGGQE